MKQLSNSLTILLLSIFSLSAYADTPFKNKLEVTLGAYFPSIDTSVRIDSNQHDVGHRFDLEDIFGLDDSETYGFGGLEYRFNDRHALELTYFDLSRDADKSISKDITIGDNTYSAGASLETEFNYEVYRASYIYNILTNKDYAVGLGIGLHITKIGISVETNSSLGSLTGSNKAELEDTSLPLPVLGLRGNWRIADNWIIDSNIDGFALKYDDYKGYLLNVGLALEYDRFKYVSFGAGWDYYNLNVEGDKDKFNGEIDYEYSGPMFYMKGRF